MLSGNLWGGRVKLRPGGRDGPWHRSHAGENEEKADGAARFTHMRQPIPEGFRGGLVVSGGISFAIPPEDHTRYLPDGRIYF
jgi:hypothetical protein